MPRPSQKTTRRPRAGIFARALTPFKGISRATLGASSGNGSSTSSSGGPAADIATTRTVSPTSTGSGPAIKELPPKLGSRGNGPAGSVRAVDSERNPGDDPDQPTTAPLLTEEEKAIVTLVDDRFMASWQSRLIHDKEYQESLAFYRNLQWVEYVEGSGYLRDLRDLSKPERVYCTSNKLRPIVYHLMARAIANQSEALYRPLTGRDKDRMATRQMRSVWSHVQQVNKWDDLLNRLRLQSIIVGPAYAYTYYDTRTVVPVPVLKAVPGDPKNPDIEDIKDKPLGEIKIGFVSTFNLYLDPKARAWEEMAWVIHAVRMDLETIKAQWPEEGRWVQPEQSSSPGEIVRTQLDAITGDMNSRMYHTGKHTAIVKTLWEKPSVAYKDGRYIVTAGGRILEPPREWLYPKMKNFPFVRLVYRDGVETAWGDNAIYPVLQPQRNRNRALSKIAERVKAGDGKLLIADGSETSPTAFRSEARDEVIRYKHSDPRNPNLLYPPPQYVPHPPLDPTIQESLAINDSDIKEITSVNDPTLGLSKQDLSGVSINALQDADQSEGTIQRDNERRFVRECAENVGVLAQQFYLKDETRLLFVQDSAPSRRPILPLPGGDGDGGPMNGAAAPPAAPGPTGAPGMPPPSPQGAPAVPGAPGGDADADEDDDPDDSPTTEAITFQHLSEGRWTVDASAAAAMSPSARRNFLMQLIQSGAFKADQLPATIALLREMELFGSDNVLTDDLLRALQHMERMAAAAPTPDPLQLAHIEAAKESIVAGALQGVKTQAEIAKIQAQSQADIAKMQAEHALPVKPSLSFAGKLTPAGEVSGEEKLGLDVHGAAAHLLDATDAHPAGGAPYGVGGAAPMDAGMGGAAGMAGMAGSGSTAGATGSTPAPQPAPASDPTVQSG